VNPAEDYIHNRAEPYRGMLLYIQTVVEHTIPELSLKYKYKIPFYYLGKRPFCYLNQSKNYVDVGFWNAAHLSVYQEYLVSDGRKVMKSLRYQSIEEITPSILEAVLKDAYRVKDKKFW